MLETVKGFFRLHTFQKVPENNGAAAMEELLFYYLQTELRFVLGLARPAWSTTTYCSGSVCSPSMGRCIVKRCHSESCTVNISGHGNQSGVCEENSAGQSVYRKRDVSGNAVSSSCLA
ncbi:hypothetical protein KUH03_16895 [Sphingobacterium sp. E70]|uniref:hypothetical protein n=1 Tax=Sphingobacterium sp. E70 TaxID=2853439 RepID=UPI00211B9224|nr:hypothetical protein [Sphingobacterium sp. E70]ULT28123.1 hypothetical protein KUH03_16895 [Sphingobacterium sp. E70]